MQTIVTPPVRSEDEHAIVRLLSPEAANQAAAVQSQLKDLFGDAIWLQQPPSLHVTLMEIICDVTYSGKTRHQYFDEWYAEHNSTVKEYLGTIEPFDITFSDILVSQRAIIITSAASKAFNELREALLERIRLPDGTKAPPDITHSTLARFNKPINLEEAQRLAAPIRASITEHVAEFSLVPDLGPPHFNSMPKQVYPLKQL